MSSGGAHDYFEESDAQNVRLRWSIATRRQLERWEPYVAASVWLGWAEEKRQLRSADIWLAEIEHHFALIAARNLLRAIDLPFPTCVSLDPTLRTELIEGRDLHEHWTENMPVFNVTPRQQQPRYPSGRKFANRNPRESPYWWLGWGAKTGAQLLPNVSAPALHRVLEDVQAEILEIRPELEKFVPPRAASPWLHQDGEWWPLADVVESLTG